MAVLQVLHRAVQDFLLNVYWNQFISKLGCIVNGQFLYIPNKGMQTFALDCRWLLSRFAKKFTWTNMSFILFSSPSMHEFSQSIPPQAFTPPSLNLMCEIPVHEVSPGPPLVHNAQLSSNGPESWKFPLRTLFFFFLSESHIGCDRCALCFFGSRATELWLRCQSDHRVRVPEGSEVCCQGCASPLLILFRFQTGSLYSSPTSAQ